MSYQNIISFASKQPSFKCYFNNGRSLLTSNQIVSFCIVEDKIGKIIQLVKDSLYNDQSITCYVDDIEVNLNNLELIKKNKDEDIGFTIEHSLAMQKYPITFVNDVDFKEFISSTIVPLKIKELIKLTNKVVISFLGSESFKKKESMLFVDSDKVPGPYVKWPPAIFEKYFSEKNSLSVPYLLPEYLFSDFSRKTFLSFLDTISEKRINKDEFLIQIGDINSIIVPGEFFLKSNEVKRIYSITEYIFQDSHNFLERLWILRQKLTDCLLEGYGVHNVPWERVLQTVKNNYYFFVHDTINKYIEQTTKLENSIVVIAQDLTKNISLIIDDLKKEILAFLATMIASFTLKIDFNLQLLFIGSAWFYSLILFITNKLKKFNFSSELVEQRINNLKKSLGEFYTLEPEKVDTTIDNYVKDLLDKLKKFEILNKYIVIGLLTFLTVLFIIIFLAR